MMLLKIENLHVSIDGKEIVKGLDLEVNAGETHAIMGPNGTGKSTLALAIAGKEGYDITRGKILFKGQDISEMAPEERASAQGYSSGSSILLKYPGVSITNFMRTSLNEIREYRKQPPLSASEFLALMEEKKKLVEIGRQTQQSFGERRFFRRGEKTE